MGYVRAQMAIHHLKLPALEIGQLVEASTLPLVCAGFDYQRLETMGDSCLKLATTVHIYNK
jgi:endoribonuclease Dicer